MYKMLKSRALFRFAKNEPLLTVTSIVFGAFCLLFYLLPTYAEFMYQKGIYALLRFLYDNSLGFLPIPSIYFFVVAIFYFMVRWFTHLKSRKWQESVFKFFKALLLVLMSFYLLWGFNYWCPGMRARLSLEKERISIEELQGELMLCAASLKKDYSVDFNLPNNLEDIVRQEQKEFLKSNGFETPGKPRIRKLLPKGILLRISTAGVYFPFVIEGHIDKGLHPIQWPATMSHEMGHAYGITDEGECNFLAYQSCIRSAHPEIRYSANIMYLRYLLSALRKETAIDYKDLLSSIDDAVLQDIRNIEQNNNQYPDILPKYRDIIYDGYLKTQGVKSGIKSYATLIQLNVDFKRSKQSKGN